MMGSRHTRARARGSGRDGPPPFVHAKCDPNPSVLAPTSNASGATVHCGATAWNLTEWQALLGGIDEGSVQGPMPSVAAITRMLAEILAL